MNTVGNKFSCRLYATLTALAVLLASSDGIAQNLPTNPWAQPQQTQEMYQQPVYQQQQVFPQPTNLPGQGAPIYYGSQPYQPTYEGGADNVWNTKMPEYTGELTTWGKDYGQRATAPEVNTHNILAITKHLRNMGYEIPVGFEERVKRAPAAVKGRINNALVGLERGNDPISKSSQFIMRHFENETGMTFDNLLGNSLDLLSSK